MNSGSRCEPWWEAAWEAHGRGWGVRSQAKAVGCDVNRTFKTAAYFTSLRNKLGSEVNCKKNELIYFRMSGRISS